MSFALRIVSNEVPAGARKESYQHDFKFDHVFDPNTSQEEIFEMVSPLIRSALDGDNVCIFAYGKHYNFFSLQLFNFNYLSGQTGSGKTFTIEGDESHLGIVPRTANLLFDCVKKASIRGRSYTITASSLEIYNEVLNDLLSNARVIAKSNDIYISNSNITQRKVTSADMLLEQMRVAKGNRATASTAGNQRSSRSHAVTRLEIVGTHATRPKSLVGSITLVDLAGSESPCKPKHGRDQEHQPIVVGA